MSITDAQFAAYLRGKKNPGFRILLEIKRGYESGGVQAEDTIYLADAPYTTKPTDSPASQRYRDVILKAPEIERGIDAKSLGGRGSRTTGPLVLNNNDNAVGFLMDVICDAREVSTYVGDKDWPRADFRRVDVSVFGSPKADRDAQLTVQLRDKSYLLDDTIIGDTIATGPNTGKPKPILMGFVKNFDITPYLLDSATLKYYINNFALDTSTLNSYLLDVRDAGVSLKNRPLLTFTSATMTANAGTDTLSYTSHGLAVSDVVWFFDQGGGPPGLFPGLSGGTQYWVLAAGLTANDFRLSLTRGGAAVDITSAVMGGTWDLNRNRFYLDTAAATLELSSSPAGRVTLDMQALDAAGAIGVSAEPHKAFKYLLQNYTALSASEYDSTAIDALAAAEASSIYYGRAILDRMNVVTLLDEIAFATYSWYGWNAAGVLTVGRLDLANLDSASSTGTINTHDMIGDPSCENLPLQWGKVVLDADRNVVVQTDGLAGAVTAANRSLWGQQFQTRVSTTDPAGATYLPNWWDYHKSAIDSKPMAAEIRGAGGLAQFVCDQITALFKPWTRLYSCAVGIDKYALNPGDCITLTYPRYGLSAGAKVRVLSVKQRWTDRAVDLVMVRQVTPDYTSASVN